MTRDNVNDLLSGHDLIGDVDLLSIDIDGNDYWVWEAVDVATPRVVIMEYNPAFGPTRAVVVPYQADCDRARMHGQARHYYGASLAALTRFAQHKGYRLLMVEPRGINAYFLRNDISPDLEACPPEVVYERSQASMRLKDIEGDIFQSIDQVGWSLVDLDRDT